MIEKKWLPKQILNLRLLPICAVSIGTILTAIVIGILIRQPVFVVGTVTILCGSIISWRYRSFGTGISEKEYK